MNYLDKRARPVQGLALSRNWEAGDLVGLPVESGMRVRCWQVPA